MSVNKLLNFKRYTLPHPSNSPKSLAIELYQTKGVFGWGLKMGGEIFINELQNFTHIFPTHHK